MHHLSRVHLFYVLNTRFLPIVTKRSFNKLLIVIIQIKLIRNVHKPTNVKVTNKFITTSTSTTSTRYIFFFNLHTYVQQVQIT